MSSWTAEPAGTSSQRNAFTMNNAPHSRNPVDKNRKMRTLFVVEDLDEDSMPERGKLQ